LLNINQNNGFVKEVKINQTLRSIVLNIAYAKLYKQKDVNSFVKKTLIKMEKSKRTKLLRYLKKKTWKKNDY